MSQNLSQLLKEAIQLELNVAKLYLLFHKLLPEDAEFWWTWSLKSRIMRPF